FDLTAKQLADVSPVEPDVAEGIGSGVRLFRVDVRNLGALGDHDDAEILTHGAPTLEMLGDRLDTRRPFGDQDEICPAGQTADNGDPASVSPHDLDDEDA